MKDDDGVKKYVNGNALYDLSWFIVRSDGTYKDMGGADRFPESVRKDMNQFFSEVCHWELVEENDELKKWEKPKPKVII